MRIRGQLSRRTPGDVLEWVKREERTGVLRFHEPRSDVRKDFWISKGVIVASGSNQPHDYLGQHLIAQGKISEEDFVRAYKTQQETKTLLGKVCVELGLVSESELEDALRRKAEESFMETFLWEDGTFELEEADALDKKKLTFTIDAQGVIRDGEVRQIEWGLIREVIPAATIAPVPNLERIDEALLDVVSKLLLELAAEGKNIAEIALEAHASQYDVMRRFYGLANKDWVVLPADDGLILEEDLEIVPLPPDAGMPDIESPRDQLERASTSGGLDVRQKIPSLQVDAAALTRMDLTPEEGFLLSRVDGNLDVEGVVAMCPFPQDAALEVLQALAERGILTLGEPSES